jgi:hypothetical protein
LEHWTVDENEPITDDGQVLLCPACNRRALAFMRAAHDAVLSLGTTEASRAALAVESALASFLEGREGCLVCSSKE